ncbi:MAG TPA: glutamine-hydrolyzing GMP synthase [Myxococcota bacterium]|nr:glutamine-hydrolyzing GMP synthase [Myxococcota bacterium]HRY95486.1 glutamine-hydrolyzing GMP synthase [Myxococcota bacterium]HSA21742.1 glutamine-hydrolyzing GMP synthase [Myxococcota bacterium]
MSAPEQPGPGGHDAIAVVDFGGQYAHLIATKVRRQRVLAEVRQPEDPTAAFRGYRGIIISGSPSLSSHGEDSAYNKEIFELPVPILGFCFGHQEIAKRYGGRVIHGGREWGPVDFRRSRPHPLFAGLAESERVWMSHFDSVVEVGPGFEELGTSRLGDGEVHRFAALGSDTLRRYGLQFHPEVDDTLHGDQMIANFVLGICGCRPSWTMARYLEEQLDAIRARAAGQSVFLLASGGVDSTVAALLLGRALGEERLHLLHIDNGLMRQGESQQVLALLRGLGLGRHLHFVDAGDEFLAALAGLVEPEQKRWAIGDTFVRVFQREAERMGLAGHLLGQGTIYPDTIETGGTRRADTIKTHHNRVPIIEEMIARGRVIEPLAELYKVEVRELGESLGIPREVVWRHPFPGPGLGVRALCADGAAPAPGELERLSAEAGAIARPRGLEALGLPVRSVGVKADLRSYERPVLLSGAAPFERLLEVAGEIYQRVAGVNRCALWLGGAPPRSARPLQATLTRERLELLREADAVVMQGLRRHGVHDQVWQCPTVLVPLELDGCGRELVVVRPVLSERAMTARPAELPAALLDELGERLLPLPGVSGLALDLTTKPPGTIEWE